MHQEGVHYLEIGETSCFYDLMGRYELRGRVYVFVKIPNKGLQMLVCQLDKLMHNFKVYRDKFRAEYLQPKPRDEDKVAWLPVGDCRTLQSHARTYRTVGNNGHWGNYLCVCYQMVGFQVLCLEWKPHAAVWAKVTQCHVCEGKLVAREFKKCR